MLSPVERRQTWSRIVGVERRAAPFPEFEGHPLPDPTRLEDEDFHAARAIQVHEKGKAGAPLARWDGPTRFD